MKMKPTLRSVCQTLFHTKSAKHIKLTITVKPDSPYVDPISGNTRYTYAPYGFRIENPLSTRVEMTYVTRPAGRSGLMAGDKILKVDGRAVGPGTRPLIDVASVMPPDMRAITLTVSRTVRR